MEPCRIISFDGGGLKGLLSLGLLERVSRELGGEDWLGRADLLAGTSTGGLIALSLAAGKSLGDIAAFYDQDGPRIFNRSSWTYRTSLGKLLHAGYDNRPLAGALEAMFGDTRLDELPRQVLVVSFDLDQKEGKRRSWAPKIFHNCPGPTPDRHLVRHVGLYTSAAPTYLPSVDGYVDGGVCANNPSMCALAQMLDPRLSAPRDIREIRLLSVGTGVNPECVSKKRVTWGVFGWNLRVLRIIMDGSVGIADYQCRQVLGPERYRRFQVDLDEPFAMDDATALPALRRVAERLDDRTVRAWADWVREGWLGDGPKTRV